MKGFLSMIRSHVPDRSCYHRADSIYRTALVVQGYQSVPHVKGTPDAHSNLLEHTTVYVCTVVDLSGFGNMLMDTVVMDVVFFQIMYLILLLIYLISFFFFKCMYIILITSYLDVLYLVCCGYRCVKDFYCISGDQCDVFQSFSSATIPGPQKPKILLDQ